MPSGWNRTATSRLSEESERERISSTKYIRPAVGESIQLKGGGLTSTSSASSVHRETDILVVGAGILGVTIAYWLSKLYDCRILLVDKETGVAKHTSSRNTGVIHRPFYLDPEGRRIFARTSELSYPLWEDLAREFDLPWKQVGTLEAATDEGQVRTLERYARWGLENGIPESDLPLLDTASVKALEPNVNCTAALFSKTDVSVDFGLMTRFIYGLASANEVGFLGGHEVTSVVREADFTKVSVKGKHGRSDMKTRLFVNAAGGGALSIAHMQGLARKYTALHFRGEYWFVDEPFASKVGRNVYTPPRHPEFPFLDPHFVVRSDGRREVGPNAALVTGPYAYYGLGLSSVGAFLEGPNSPKLRLLTNSAFLSMVAGEWQSSLSKRAMCSRVSRFISGVRPGMLTSRGVSGIRSSVVGEDGFLPEALLLHEEGSLHIVNYNSPGATGAPAFSAMLVADLRERGALDGFRRKSERPDANWKFDRAVGAR